MDNIEIDRHYIRQKIWQYFRNATRSQMTEVLHHIRNLIGNDKWTEKIAFMVHEEVSSLANNSIIMFAQPVMEGAGSYSGYPWITVTSYGQKCLAEEILTPYDPEDYIQKVIRMVPGIDEITIKYVGESINAFNRRAPISATIALGIASEQIMLLLIEAYLEALQNTREKDALLKKVRNRFIETQYKEFRKFFDSRQKTMPRKIVQDIDTAIDSTFRFIKMMRNEQGHPTSIDADRNTIYADLQHFPHYARRVFALIAYLKENKV